MSVPHQKCLLHEVTVTFLGGEVVPGGPTTLDNGVFHGTLASTEYQEGF
jgi:hypothetical protein